MARARDVGFSVLITGAANSESLERSVAHAALHEIKVFGCINPIADIRRLWPRHYPDEPIPWQVLDAGQEAALAFINAGRNRFIIPYQWGGEPVMENEVLYQRIACFSNRKVIDLLKTLIDDILSVSGIGGLAMDGFGYQNYHRCYCERCERLLQEFKQHTPEVANEEAEVIFFRQLLVDVINELASYARTRDPKVKTTLHIWPVFAPEPLYGNRLDVDFCGQTAAWYTLWPQQKIAEYSRITVEDARKHFPRQTGVGMIGYYDMPGRFPVKSPEVVEMELSTMIENGCRRIQVCGTQDVINNPEVAAVFRRIFKADDGGAPILLPVEPPPVR